MVDLLLMCFDELLEKRRTRAGVWLDEPLGTWPRLSVGKGLVEAKIQIGVIGREIKLWRYLLIGGLRPPEFFWSA